MLGVSVIYFTRGSSGEVAFQRPLRSMVRILRESTGQVTEGFDHA